MSRDDLFPVDDAAPAVFGAEHEPEPEESESERIPAEQEAASSEVVFVPSERIDEPRDEVTLRLSRTEDDELVLLAFSSPERLAVCLGDEQPWLAVPKTEVEFVRQRCEAAFVELDPVLPRDQ